MGDLRGSKKQVKKLRRENKTKHMARKRKGRGGGSPKKKSRGESGLGLARAQVCEGQKSGGIGEMRKVGRKKWLGEVVEKGGTGRNKKYKGVKNGRTGGCLQKVTKSGGGRWGGG